MKRKKRERFVNRGERKKEETEGRKEGGREKERVIKTKC